MLDFSELQFEDFVIHWVGNKHRDEGTILSESLIHIGNEEVKELLYKYLLDPFRKSSVKHRFVHTTDLRFNEVYTYVKQVFSFPETLLHQSKNVARHLYDSSVHTRIKGGEFYMVHLKNLKLDDVVTDAIGIFRTENKESYLKVVESNGSFGVESDIGININALDKGCLVFNIEESDGYRILVVDTHGRESNPARYWREDFLCVDSVRTEDIVTQEYMGLVGDFLNEKVSVEDPLKPVELRTNTIQFFEQNEQFEASRFEEEVLKEPETIEAFRSYRGDYESEHGAQQPDQFTISPASVKSAKRKMRSVIKLDSSFTIYLRNFTPIALENMERGRDSEKGKQYYKFYFTEET